MRELIELGEDKNVAVTQAFANSQWPQFADFLTAANLDAGTLRQHLTTEELRKSILNQMVALGVVKVKIYNLDGLTVFSTEEKQIGEEQSDNPGFLSARSGNVVSELIYRDTFNAFDQMIEKRHVISTYIPLKRHPQGSIIEGVFELYSDVTPLLQRIQRTERIVVGGIILILALLYVILFFIVRRADLLITKKSDDLRKLSQAVEQSVNTIIIADIHGNIEYVNSTFTEITGYTLEEVLGQNLHFLSRTHHDEQQYKELWDSITSGETWHGEFHNKRKDGTVSWEYATISPMYDENGQMTHFIEVKEDITERKQAEEALHESQRQLEASLQREKERRLFSETLRKVSRIVGSTLEEDKVVDLILGQLEYVITYHRATVSTLEKNTLTLIAGRDKMGGVIDSFSFPANKYPINAQVLTEKQPILIPDVTHDSRWQETSSMRGIRSFISTPLLVQNQPVGTLAVGRVDDTPYTDEEAQFVFAFASQVAIAIRNAQLHAEVRNRMEQELYTARQIQKSLLAFDVPEIPGLDIARFSQSAREVGGDFYNFSVFDERHLGIAVGDVSGKGMQAALMMSLSFGLLTTEVRHTITPAALMTTMNTELRAHTQHNKMNTALGYITLDKNGNSSGGQWHLQASNAGLIAPLIRYKDGNVEWLDVAGLPLGAVEGLKYTELDHKLQVGDIVLLTSDGIVEAMNDDGEMYGFDRLVEGVANADCQNAQTMLDCVLAEVNAFVAEAEVHDDLALVAVMVKS